MGLTRPAPRRVAADARQEPVRLAAGWCGLRGVELGNMLEVVEEERANAPGTDQTAAQPVRFQGQYCDNETSLHYSRFRYYDPDIGRFLSIEPVGLAGGSNSYGYAYNPITWIDQKGLSPCKTNTTGAAISSSSAAAPRFQSRRCRPS